jgi:hypothetical protein
VVAFKAILSMFIVGGTFLAVIEMADFWIKRRELPRKSSHLNNYKFKSLTINKQ